MVVVKGRGIGYFTILQTITSMRILKRLILIALIVGIFFGIRYLSQMLPVLTGFAAKAACSCIHGAGRTAESVRAQELGHFPQNLAKIEVIENGVTASAYGFAKAKAIYREGLGCTLVVGLSEGEIQNQKIKGAPQLAYNPDTINWPMGNVMPDTFPAGINVEKVNEVLATAFEEKDPEKPVNTRAVLIVYNDQLVAERYGESFGPYDTQLGWSMTKSVTNALIGTLVKTGKISLEDNALFEEWDDERKAITLDNMLKMSSGISWTESYYSLSPITRMLYTVPSMGKYSASFDLEAEPGQLWEYSSGTTNMLSRKIWEITGEDYHQYPYTALFHKIGMTSARIEMDASGAFVGSSYGWATPRDWARFGLLYLNDGIWQGERILPEGWVKYSSEAIPEAPNGVYGAHFWKFHNKDKAHLPQDAFMANGFSGQSVIIIPSKDLVIVRMGQTHYGNFDFDTLIQGVIAAIE